MNKSPSLHDYINKEYCKDGCACIMLKHPPPPTKTGSSCVRVHGSPKAPQSCLKKSRQQKSTDAAVRAACWSVLSLGRG